jgi:5-oxopent-3-ene-1,2,5-tricarboxylate decarboxylase/2-hydroxyhepta-2,4-diene-1,7-dioate isomerase
VTSWRFSSSRAHRLDLVAGPLGIPAGFGAQPTASEEVLSTALGGDWEFRGIRPPARS